MGFKFKRIDFTVGSEEFPAGSTQEIRQTRSKFIVKSVAQKLIDMNIGWQLDASRNETVTDYAEVPNNSNVKWPGLFLVNSTSGCKLFVSYIAQGYINNFSGSDIVLSNTNVRTVAGLCMSMIPSGSSSSFGLEFNESFLPSDATRIDGTAKEGSLSICYDPSASWICSCGIYASENVISPVFAISTNGINPPLKIPCYAIGKVLGTVSHLEDNKINSKYGVICFRIPNTSSGTSWLDQGEILYGTSLAFNTTLYFIGASSEYFVNCGSVCKSDGSWLIGFGSSPNRCIKIFPSCIQELSNKVFSSSGTGKSRWIPLAIASYSEDPTTYGIVSGDGFKGYLDTDLFRIAISTYGQKFDNGNFIAVTDSYNFLMGWDPDNTDSIA